MKAILLKLVPKFGRAAKRKKNPHNLRNLLDCFEHEFGDEKLDREANRQKEFNFERT